MITLVVLPRGAVMPVVMFLQCATLALTETWTISIVKSAPAIVSIAVITFMDARKQVGYEKTRTFVKLSPHTI